MARWPTRLRHTRPMSNALRSVAVHRASVLGLMVPTEVVSVPLAASLGLAAAREIVAPIAIPLFDNSAMDGYAVRAADVAAAPVSLLVAADIPAGSVDQIPLVGRTAHRIMTGAPMPIGADAVVRVEWTDGGVEVVYIDRPVEVGTAVRRAGEDIGAGDLVAAIGDEITPGRIGLLASLGIAELTVRRRVRVAVLSTGDELNPLGTSLPPGGIYDSNSYLVAAAVRSAGGEPVVVRSIADDVAAARSELASSATGVDLVITTGGISVGAYEVVKEALGATHDVTFHSVAVRPGKPQGLGMIGRTPVIALPGNPVSAFVSFELFVRPALRVLAGHRNLDRPTWSLTLGETVRRSPDRCLYLLGRYEPGTGIAYPVARTGSHLISALSLANALIVVPEGTGSVVTGARVDVLPID